MKRIAMALLASCVLLQVRAAELDWLTDLPTAQAQAKSENKMVLLDFTGSDWCEWCMKFDKEVFATSEFQDYAAKNVVLVRLDYPHRKKQSAKLQIANFMLKNQYDIQEFPTLVVLNQAGDEIGRQTGYSEGGPQAFIAELEKFKAKK
jgi:protein disulfide-isomerase